MRGFTLIELLTVIGIVAILAALLFPVFSAVRERSRMAVCQSNLKQLGAAFHLYLSDWDDYYPLPYTDHLSSTGNDFGLPTWKKRIFFYVKSPGVFDCPSNGFTERISQHPAFTPDSNSAKALAETGAPFAYGMNGNQFIANNIGGELQNDAVSASDLKAPGQVILLGEVQAGPHIQSDVLLFSDWDKTTVEEQELRPPYGSFYFAHYANGKSNWLFCDGHVKPLRVKDTLVPRNIWIDPGFQVYWSDHYQTTFQQQCDRAALQLPPRWR